MIQRDYIERLIQQAIQGLAQAIALIRRGELDPALLIVEKTTDLVLGPLRPAFEKLEAASAVALVAKPEMEKVRIYAALLAEQGAVHEIRGNQPLAFYLYRRSLDFYDAGRAAGLRPLPADIERIADLEARLRTGGGSR